MGEGGTFQKCLAEVHQLLVTAKWEGEVSVGLGGWQPFPVKAHIVNISGFGCQMVSAETTQLPLQCASTLDNL